jgi:hypothetical protein
VRNPYIRLCQNLILWAVFNCLFSGMLFCFCHEIHIRHFFDQRDACCDQVDRINAAVDAFRNGHKLKVGDPVPSLAQLVSNGNLAQGDAAGVPLGEVHCLAKLPPAGQPSAVWLYYYPGDLFFGHGGPYEWPTPKPHWDISVVKLPTK